MARGLSKIFLASAVAMFTGNALACASCGCSLSSDWDTQGLGARAGFKMDLRYDFLNQNQVRSGSNKVDTWPQAGHEQELYTINRYTTLGLDYTSEGAWGVNVQLPYINRSHATNGMNFDGTDYGESHTQSLGDVKVLARYNGFLNNPELGLQFGLKLPTGSHTETFNGGPIAGQPLDRGLQPGTGTTDLLVGGFKTATLTQTTDGYLQVLGQFPLNSKDGYKTGNSVNVNLGVRYTDLGRLEPQFQLNARAIGKDKGANATPDDSGGVTLYASPGATYKVTDKLTVYGFLQLPVYQYLNGYQLAPRYLVSAGTRFSF